MDKTYVNTVYTLVLLVQVRLSVLHVAGVLKSEINLILLVPMNIWEKPDIISLINLALVKEAIIRMGKIVCLVYPLVSHVQIKKHA